MLVSRIYEFSRGMDSDAPRNVHLNYRPTLTMMNGPLECDRRAKCGWKGDKET